FFGCPRWSAVFGLGFLRLFRGLFDPAPGGFVPIDDALGVGAQQDRDAVPGPRGDLGRVAGRVEPGRDGGVAQVVRTPRERGGGLGRRQRQRASSWRENADPARIRTQVTRRAGAFGRAGFRGPRSPSETPVFGEPVTPGPG